MYGYSQGSKLKRPLSLVFKMSLREWPELYLGMCHALAGGIILSYFVILQEKNMDYTCRFKKHYTIYRADDPRTALYPKPYVTDSHLLPKDHPMTSKEIKKYKLEPTYIHENDPKMYESFKQFMEGGKF